MGDRGAMAPKPGSTARLPQPQGHISTGAVGAIAACSVASARPADGVWERVSAINRRNEHHARRALFALRPSKPQHSANTCAAGQHLRSSGAATWSVSVPWLHRARHRLQFHAVPSPNACASCCNGNANLETRRAATSRSRPLFNTFEKTCTRNMLRRPCVCVTLPVCDRDMGPGLTSSCKAPSEAFAVGCGESLGAPRWPGLLTTRATGQVPSDHPTLFEHQFTLATQHHRHQY
jgi:hypothetical protein